MTDKLFNRVQKTIQILSDHFGVPPSIILERSQNPKRIWIRGLFFYFGTKYASATRLQMAIYPKLHGLDSFSKQTVSHAIRRVKEVVSSDPKKKEEFENIKGQIEIALDYTKPLSKDVLDKIQALSRVLSVAQIARAYKLSETQVINVINHGKAYI